MPSISFNKTTWDGKYDWANRGDEWSAAWGGPFMQWHGSLLPRIKAHLPAKRILEIAPGYGRWTEYLKDLCEHLTAVDLSEECINACKQRFSACRNITYVLNDGASLQMIDDESVDFAFSFDSLVHADISVIESYLSQMHRILSPGGVCFIHHSNLGEYRDRYARIRSIPKLESVLRISGLLSDRLQWRDPGVDATVVQRIADKHGLKCVSQELVHWNTKRTFLDCMTTLVRADSPFHAASNVVFRNSQFMNEARNLSSLSRLYDPMRYSPRMSSAEATPTR